MRQHRVLAEAVPVALVQFEGRSRMPNRINTHTDELGARDGSISLGDEHAERVWRRVHGHSNGVGLPERDRMEALLVDDHAMVRQALKFYLEELDSSVAVNMAENVDEALEFASHAEKLDLIILDYKLPGTVGLAGFEALAAAVPDVPIVFLSGNMHRNEVLRAIGAGAAGVIPKDLSAEAMINALKLVLSGEKYLPTMILPDSDQTGVVSQKMSEGPLSDLTQRQREVMELLMQGLPNKEIAESLGVEEVTVKLHLSKIFKKLGVSNRTQAVRIAMGAPA